MKQVRNNVFETNSSSTHSICISKAPVTIEKHIHFNIGEYGWEVSCVDTPSYLYTAILEQCDSDDLLNKLIDILDSYSIKYEFEEPDYDYSDDGKRKWLKYGYIDHSGETREFIDAVLNDEDLLMRCLFGDSCVYTGNDNGCDYDNMCYAEHETIWDDDDHMVPNYNHDSEKYDYFFKGN